MGFDAVTVDKFGGLRLSSDPGDVGLGAAVDLNNVDFANDLSYVRSRDGSTPHGAAGAISGVNIYALVAQTLSTGLGRLVVVSETPGSPVTVHVDVFSGGGVMTALGSFTIANEHFFHDTVSLGTSANDYVFLASEGELLQIIAGGAVIASVGKPKYVAAMPTSNRLVQGFYFNAADTPSGANGDRSCLFFSDPDVPTVYTATNFVHLRPGDGEDLRGLATWRGQMFAFKETAMYVFAGEGTDATGEPVFDYRSVELGGRVLPANVSGTGNTGRVIAAGAEGVYYLTADGVYRTTGGPPVKISQALDDGFRDGTILPHTLSVARHRVLVGTLEGVYVFDERNGQWTRWTFPAAYGLMRSGFIAWDVGAPGGPDSLYYAGADTVLYSDRDEATDDGELIASSYQSGYADLGSPALKVIARSQVWGTGLVTYAMGVDYGDPDTGSDLQLGASPAVEDAIEVWSRRGYDACFKLASPAGAWRVNALALLLSARYPVGVKA
jgi:hypothetical protein